MQATMMFDRELVRMHLRYQPVSLNSEIILIGSTHRIDLQGGCDTGVLELTTLGPRGICAAPLVHFRVASSLSKSAMNQTPRLVHLSIMLSARVRYAEWRVHHDSRATREALSLELRLQNFTSWTAQRSVKQSAERVA